MALPQTQGRTSNIIAFAQQLKAKRHQDHRRRPHDKLAVHDSAAERERASSPVSVADVNVALNEDTNFQGVSETLQNAPAAGRTEVMQAAANALAERPPRRRHPKGAAQP